MASKATALEILASIVQAAGVGEAGDRRFLVVAVRQATAGGGGRRRSASRWSQSHSVVGSEEESSRLHPSLSIIGLAAIVAHHDDLGVEPSQRLNQITLLGHHFLNVLVGVGHFVGTRSQNGDTSFSQFSAHR